MKSVLELKCPRCGADLSVENDREMQDKRTLLTDFLHNPEKERIVIRLFKDRPPAIAPSHDVVARSLIPHSLFPCHIAPCRTVNQVVRFTDHPALSIAIFPAASTYYCLSICQLSYICIFG